MLFRSNDYLALRVYAGALEAAIACLEAKGDLARLSNAIDNGLNDGLTVSEIKETLS